MKQKILFLITPVIIGGLLVYSWLTFLLTDFRPAWQQYLATALFIPIIISFFKNFKQALLLTGCYLILGTCNLLSYVPWVAKHSYWIEICGVKLGTPQFQLLSFLLLILFSALNFYPLVHMYLDYKDAQKEKRSRTP